MLCTNSLPLLYSPEGRIALNYRRAINVPKFNPNAKDLLITWDILMQDYRCVNMAACNMLNLIPVAQFWNFFNKKLSLMSASDKVRFMNS